MAISTYADILRRQRPGMAGGYGIVAGDIPGQPRAPQPTPGPLAPPAPTGPVESALDRARRIASSRSAGGTAADSILSGAGRTYRAPGAIRTPGGGLYDAPGLPVARTQPPAGYGPYGGINPGGAVPAGAQTATGGLNPQQLELQKKIDAEYDAAKAANESRYNEGMKMYQDLYQRGMAGLTGQGEQARKDIASQYAQSVAEGQQGLAARGLGNSTLLGNVSLGAARDSAASTARLNESLAQQRLAADQGLTQNMGNWIQNREDPYPRTDMYLELMKMMGENPVGNGRADYTSPSVYRNQIKAMNKSAGTGSGASVLGKAKKTSAYKLGDLSAAQKKRQATRYPKSSANKSTAKPASLRLAESVKPRYQTAYDRAMNQSYGF